MTIRTTITNDEPEGGRSLWVFVHAADTGRELLDEHLIKPGGAAQVEVHAENLVVVQEDDGV